MNFTELLDEFDRPKIHVNDLVQVLEDTIRTLNAVKQIVGSGSDPVATALNSTISKSQTKLFAVLDQIQSLGVEDALSEQS